MSKQPKVPLIRHSGLTGNRYIVTRYTMKDTHVVAHTKYDCTEQVEAILAPLEQRIAGLERENLGQSDLIASLQQRERELVKALKDAYGLCDLQSSRLHELGEFLLVRGHDEGPVAKMHAYDGKNFVEKWRAEALAPSTDKGGNEG